jgi:hypothetical protein
MKYSYCSRGKASKRVLNITDWEQAAFADQEVGLAVLISQTRQT